MSEEIDIGETSDGYHTFNELYEHRSLLYLWSLIDVGRDIDDNVYWVKDHYLGWDLVATNVGRKQISYHVPEKYRPILEKNFTKKESLDHVYDGHTSKDVASRLYERLLELSK